MHSWMISECTSLCAKCGVDVTFGLLNAYKAACRVGVDKKLKFSPMTFYRLTGLSAFR